MKRVSFVLLLGLLLGVSVITLDERSARVEAQSSGPEMLVPNLAVRTTVSDLITPISMAFLGANDFLVLEKNGNLWEEENGDDSFSELNLAEPGFNSGWVQIMGPPERLAQYKAIETKVF